MFFGSFGVNYLNIKKYYIRFIEQLLELSQCSVNLYMKIISSEIDIEFQLIQCIMIVY